MEFTGSSSDGIDNISVRGQSYITPTMPYIIDYLKCLQVRSCCKIDGERVPTQILEHLHIFVRFISFYISQCI